MKLTEEEYRGIPLDSSSSLKDFSLDRRKYYRKYILNEKITEKENKATNMGKLVETILMEPDRFDDMFFMSSLISVPGGMLGDFIYSLSQEVAHKVKEVDDFDDDEFEEIAKKVFSNTDFKLKFETVLAKLKDPNNALYYKECLNVHALNMVMVTSDDVTNAEKIVSSLKNNIFTHHIITTKTNLPDFEVIDQFKISNYVINDVHLKSMLDKVIINHKTKTIYPYDLKCTWSVENFYKEYYLFRRSYIQAYLYKEALKSLTKDEDSKFYNYTVENIKFIVCDSINYYEPLIYTISDKDMLEAYHGFEHKDIFYPGVEQILDELKWAKENDIWTVSKSNFLKKGTLNIKERS